MDPASLHIVMNALAPVLGALVAFSCPVGILWIIKHHQLRMKELEIEGRRISDEQRLAMVEAKLSAIESALTPADRSSVQERAALLEGPGAAPALESSAGAARARQR